MIPDWSGQVVAVLATGPSLTAADISRAKGTGAKLIGVNDSYRLAPFIDILYACDALWWELHLKEVLNTVSDDTRLFTCSDTNVESGKVKEQMAAQHDVTIVPGEYKPGFCLQPPKIHYGGNSGFQALNLALHTQAERILLLGLNMSCVEGKRHFFGDHPAHLNRVTTYDSYINEFVNASKDVAAGKIVNCTRDSALTCFPVMTLEEALDGHARTAAV